MEVVWLGHVGYPQALEFQMGTLDRRLAGEIPDTLLLLTHPHVYTIGRTGDEANLLVSADSLEREGIPVVRVSRGGDVTYHGPGQLVGYPIVRLARPDVVRFVRSIEAALIDSLAAMGIPAGRIEGLTGVWTERKKIASIGIGVRRWITYHGFALNVNTDLSYFRRIHPCGLKGVEATSMAEIAGREIPMEGVRDAVSLFCGRRLRGFS